MESDDRIIAKLDYFRERTEQDLIDIKSRLDQLWSFRIFLLGGAMALSGISTLAINLAFFYLKEFK